MTFDCYESKWMCILMMFFFILMTFFILMMFFYLDDGAGDGRLMTMLILRHSIDHNDYNDHDGSAIDKNLRIMTAILERACLWYFLW